MPNSLPKIALVACQVLQGEIELLSSGATHVACVQYFEIGLHDHPDKLRETLQKHIDSLDERADIDVIVLGYGLCGLGTAGLRARRHPLVIPRAHDCITLFFGSKEKYAESQASCPGCYYYTPGWNRARRVPGPDRLAALRASLEGRFDAEDIEFLVDTEKNQWAARGVAIYLELQTPDANAEADYARGCAEHLGWSFRHVHGDPTLLRDLIWCHWDNERFLNVGPSQKITHTVDASIIKAERP